MPIIGRILLLCHRHTAICTSILYIGDNLRELMTHQEYVICLPQINRCYCLRQPGHATRRSLLFCKRFCLYTLFVWLPEIVLTFLSVANLSLCNRLVSCHYTIHQLLSDSMSVGHYHCVGADSSFQGWGERDKWLFRQKLIYILWNSGIVKANLFPV